MCSQEFTQLLYKLSLKIELYNYLPAVSCSGYWVNDGKGTVLWTNSC